MLFAIQINALSALCCFILLIAGYRSESSLSTSTKLILFLCLSDMIYHITNIITWYLTGADKLLCNIFMPMNMFTMYAGVFWSSAIALFVYFTLKYPNMSNFPKSIIIIAVVWFLIALFLSILYISFLHFF